MKEEITVLRKENESLRNEIQQKDLLIKSFERDDSSQNKDNLCFQIPKRTAACPMPKNPWNYPLNTRNRFMPLVNDTYADIV